MPLLGGADKRGHTRPGKRRKTPSSLLYHVRGRQTEQTGRKRVEEEERGGDSTIIGVPSHPTLDITGVASSQEPFEKLWRVFTRVNSPSASPPRVKSEKKVVPLPLFLLLLLSYSLHFSFSPSPSLSFYLFQLFSTHNTKLFPPP